MADKGYVVEHVGGYRVLSAKKSWDSRLDEFFYREGCDGLRLFEHPAEWDELEIDFVSDLPLRCLSVVSHKVRDLSPVQALEGLEELSLFCGRAKRIPDLRAFPKLLRLYLHWRNGAESVLAVKGLERLHLTSFPGERLEGLLCRDLLELRLFKCPKLRGIGGPLPNLAELGLFQCRSLKDVQWLEEFSGIEELWVEACGALVSIEGVEHCGRLTRLQFTSCKEIESIRPVAGLSHLKMLCIDGTTRVLDGDVAFLKDLPAMERIIMTPRRSYNMGHEALQAELDAARSEGGGYG